MYRTLAFFLLSSIFSLCQSQTLISFESYGITPVEDLDVIPGVTIDYSVEYYKLVYNTVDTQGEPTIASGGYARPITDDCPSGFPLMIYMHGTVLNKEEVPSRDVGEAVIAKLIGGLGYHGIAPDYLGMGDSPGLHPYLHAESEAQSGIDMIRAVREFLEQEFGAQDNGELFVTGYSQGGHAAMALHQKLETEELLEEFDLIASTPGSGPYDLSGTQTPVLLSDEPYSNPGYVVYTLVSYDLAYGNIYETYSDVLQSPYDEVVVPYFDGNNTTLSMAQLNPQLPMVLSDLMVPEYLDEFANDDQHPFRSALADNDLYDWTPQRPIRMYYCTQDEQVDFNNSVTAETVMQANGASDVEAVDLGPFDHSGCYFFYMLSATTYFDGLRTPCDPLSLDEFEETFFDIVLLGSNGLQLQLKRSASSLRVLDNVGRIVFSIQDVPAGSHSFDLAGHSHGLFTIEVIDAYGQSHIKRYIHR